jgi:glycine cleavage system transcriptional repressor
MNLAITVLGKKSTAFLTNILAAISTHKCTILELDLSRFSETSLAAHLLVQGNWNCLAKLETALEHLQKRMDIKIHTLHIEQPDKANNDAIPYSLETICINREDVVQDMLTFLLTRHIIIAQMKCCCYPADYTETLLLNLKLVILLPATIPLMSFREELLNFCDNCNMDAIFEPIKR